MSLTRRRRLSSSYRLGFLFLLLLAPIGALARQQSKEGLIQRQFGRSRAEKAEPAKPATVIPTPHKSKPKQKNAPPKQKTAEQAAPMADSAARLTLGYSIVRVGKSTGEEQSLVVKAGEVFRIGDRIRLIVEANAGGYLYIFNTVDGKDPEMIFPTSRLNEGDNWIAAHVPFEFPSRLHPDPRLQWMQFFDPPGSEQLYLVLSREPLADIPAGKALVALCERQDCSQLRPQATAWNKITAADGLPKQKEMLHSEARPLAEEVNKSVARRIRLAPEAPKPTVLHQNQSANAKQIVVVVNLESRK